MGSDFGAERRQSSMEIESSADDNISNANMEEVKGNSLPRESEIVCSIRSTNKRVLSVALISSFNDFFPYA